MSSSEPPDMIVGTNSYPSLEVSRLGFGCMGLTGNYNSPVLDDVGIAVIKHAFDNWVTFFDTSDKKGPRINEILVGKALKELPREEVQLATKFGVVQIHESGMVVSGKPEYVRACCEASLEHLGVDYIDLYYYHWIDRTVPIEETLSNKLGSLRSWLKKGK